MRTRTLLAALTMIAGALASPVAAGAQIPFTACQPAGFSCAGLTVPLDRSGVLAGTVTLAVTRLAAPSNPTRTAIVALAGGPGQPALPAAATFASILKAGLTTRDLLVFDQRGSGSSGALRCSALESASQSTTTSEVRACAAQIGATRGLYRSSESVDDIESLRVAGGYDKLLLFGVSYGTKVALDYAARYPTHVEALILDSIVPPEGSDPLNRSSLQAVAPALADLCRGGGCSRISKSPRRDLSTLVKRIDRRALRGIVNLPDDRRASATLDPFELFQILIAGDLNPALRAETPAAVRSAVRGDGTPLLRLLVRSAGITGTVGGSTSQEPDTDEVNLPLFAATRCEETVFPWDRAAGAQQRASQARSAARALPRAQLGAFTAGVAYDSEAIPVCLGWPNAAPAPAAPGPLPAVPTLLLEGAGDVRTPISDGATVAARIAGARLVTVPYTGHSVVGSDLSGCAQAAVAAFLAGTPVAACDPAKGRLFTPVRIAPRSLNAVGTGSKALQTITAAVRTVSDVARQFIGDAITAGRATRSGDRVAGLRAGSAVARSNGTRLRSVQYVPGVAVSGFVPESANRSFRLTIRGSSAARGTITVRADGSVSGRLGGRRISARPARAASGDDRPWPTRGLAHPVLVG